MQRSRGTLTLLAFGLVAFPAALVAQTTTSSALAGIVKDPAGKPLAGALVRITSNTMIGGEKTTVTSANGSYRFVALPPGRFKITVESKGLAPLTQTEVLELGRTSNVNWKFPGAAGTTVEVVATSADLESAPVGLTTNYNTAELANLPTDRTLTGIMNLTPGVNDNYAWGGDTRANAWMMDGLNISDPQSNGQWIYPNPDWFSEIQVGGIGAAAEFGGFTGGFVNGLIKRGSNEFEGNFSGYYQDNKWEAISTNKNPGYTAEDKILPPAKNWDFAFSVGGPIVKDKLWFFTSFERKETDTTPIGAAIPSKRRDILGLVKLTWQVTPSATLEALAEYDYLQREHRGIDSTTEPDATNREIAPDHSYGLTWTQTIGSNKVFTLKAFGYAGRYDQPGYKGSDPGLDMSDVYNGIEYYHNPTTVDYNYRNRFTLSATLDIFKSGLFTATDSHAFRMGIEREALTDEEVETTPGTYGYMGQFITNEETGNDEPYTDYAWQGGGWNIHEHATRLTAFLQDTWTVNDRLTILPGIRFEKQQANAYGQPTVWNTTTFAPRLGITYALTADQKNLLKFHWGRFFEAYSASFIDRMYKYMAPAEVHFAWGDPNNNYAPMPIVPSDYNTWKPGVTGVSPEGGTPIDLSAPTDPNAKQPYMDETTFSYDHKFDGPWSLSAVYLYRVNKDSLLAKETGTETGTWDPAGYDVWDYRHDPEGNNQINVPLFNSSIPSDQHHYLVTNIPEAKRAFWSASAVLTRKLQDNWSLTASYTRARRYGNSYKTNGYDPLFLSPNNYQYNSNGLLPGFNDDEVKIHALYETPWKMRISGSFTYLSGTHYTPYARIYDAQDIRYNPNVEPLGSEKYGSRHLLDLRLAQMIPLSRKASMEVFVDIFNVLNTGTATSWTERMNSWAYMIPTTVESGRRPRIGLRVNF